MAQTNYTPISLYYSTTASAAPTAGNLVNGELAINITDGKLFYKDNAGNVQVLAGKGGTGIVAGSNTQVQYNNNGVFGASSNLTFNGTTLTSGGFATTGTTSTGVLSVTGNSTIGDASADTLTVNATITSNLLFTDNTYDIGASGATRPRTGYFGTNLFANSAGAQGVGLNVNSLAWTTTDYNVVQGKQWDSVAFNNSTAGGLYLTSNLANTTASAGWEYKNNLSGLVHVLNSYGGEYQWWTAPVNSGGSGTAASVTKRMALSIAGNLALGSNLNPSPSSIPTLEVGTSGSSLYSLSTTTFAMGSNFYYNGGNKFATNGRAALYQQDSGVHFWYSSNISNSGGGGVTANMDLIGTLSYASGGFLAIGSGNTQVSGENLQLVKGSGAVYMIAQETTNNTRFIAGVDGSQQESLIGSYSNHSVQMRVNNTPVARFFSNGMNIGDTTPLAAAYNRNLEIYTVGNSSAGVRLYNSGTGSAGYDFVLGTDATAYLINRNNANLNFGINGAVADMVLDTNKNLMIGAASGINDDRLVIRNTSTGYVALRALDPTDGANRAAMFGYANANNNYVNGTVRGDAIVRGTNSVWLGANNGSNGAQLTSAGYWNVAGQPAFYAYGAQSSVPDGTTYQAANTYFNRGSNYSTSTYRFTVPTGGAGMYIFQGNLRIDANQSYIYFDPKINGTRVYNSTTTLPGLNTTGFSSFTAGATAFMLYLNDGDYVEMNIGHSGGSPGVSQQTFWCGTKVS